MLLVQCRCAMFNSRRNATNSFNFDDMPYRGVPYNVGTCFMSGLGDQNVNRVCRLAVLRSACNTFLHTTLSCTNSKFACHQGTPNRATFLSEYSESSPFVFTSFSLTHLVIRKLHGKWHPCSINEETTTGPKVSLLFLMLYCWLFEQTHD